MAVSDGRPAGQVDNADRDVMKARAEAFLGDRVFGADRGRRIKQALESIDMTGSYEQTEEEREYGCKAAWRDFPGCIGRPGWKALNIIDVSHTRPGRRSVQEACDVHIRYGTNGGRLRPLLTLLQPDRPGRPGPRIWSDQLIRYAGEAQPDGSILGDPKHVELTALARRLGWQDEIDPFTVMPVMMQIPGQEPVFWRLAPKNVLQVELSHPRHQWFRELGLRWHALPAISRMRLRIGGIDYPCVFSGWYVATSEVVENLGDPERYGQLPVIADRLGLDRSDSLWEDEAELVLKQAIAYSFRAAGVMHEDHHGADRRHHRWAARRQGRGEIVHGDLGQLVLAGATVSCRARKGGFVRPDVDADPTFFHPAVDPWRGWLAAQ